MDKNVKKEYVAPVIVVKSVEVESPICSGSPDNVQATSPATTANSQKFNNAFTSDNNFSEGSWDAPDFSSSETE